MCTASDASRQQSKRVRQQPSASATYTEQSSASSRAREVSLPSRRAAREEKGAKEPRSRRQPAAWRTWRAGSAAVTE